jgi:hypothetical protein
VNDRVRRQQFVDGVEATLSPDLVEPSMDQFHVLRGHVTSNDRFSIYLVLIIIVNRARQMWLRPNNIGEAQDSGESVLTVNE